MTPGLTNATKTNMLKYFLNAIPEEVPAPSPVFAGLLIDQGGPEPNELIIGTAGYTRASVEFIVVDGVAKNSSSITFPKALSDWTPGTSRITHIAFFASHFDMDSSSWISDETDPMIAVLPLSEAESVHASETFQLNPQAVKMQLL